VLFTLSPCIVKEAFFNVVSVDYAKPLNKAKTITLNSCQYWQNKGQQLSIFKQSEINPDRLPIDDLKKQFTVFQSLKTPVIIQKIALEVVPQDIFYIND
jgi:hypothetical protein